MQSLSVTVACFVVAACLAAVPAAAQTEEPAPAPRTAWGQPDLGGVWEYKTRTPLERPEQFDGREFLTAEEAAEIEERERARIQAMEERPAQRTIAIPTAGGRPGRWLDEMMHTVRVIPLDGRPAPQGGIRQYVGEGRGYWDGDTLVVETVNFNDDRTHTTWRNTGRNRTLVERFTRVDADTLLYEFTVTDPDTWERPWSAELPMQRSELPIYEFACHEGNYGLENILAGNRRAEAAGR